MNVIRRQFLQIAGAAATASVAAGSAWAQTPQTRKRGGIFGRKTSRKYDRQTGAKRRRRTIAEKLRKYEVKGEGYEFVPAMMHLLRRYNAALPDRAKTEMDRRLAKALDQIPKSKDRVAEALKRDQAIPRELKRRAFSPKYLDMKIDQGIDVAEMAEVVARGRRLQNTSVRVIQATAILAGKVPGTEKADCGCCCSTPPPPTGPEPTPTAPPNKYELTFGHLYCVDESDPEWGGSDEPYVVFAALTEEMAEEGTPAYGVHTPKYEDVDDGDRRPATGNANLLLYGRTGPKEIASSLLITAACFEWDGGDLSETTDDLRAALTAAATTAVGAGGVVGWIVGGAAVLAIGVTYLVDLLSGDDAIGSTIAVSLTAADADAKTEGVNPYVFPPLHFDGGDDDGIYDAYLSLRRV